MSNPHLSAAQPVALRLIAGTVLQPLCHVAGRASPKGARLGRPSEAVLDQLASQQGAFGKENGERMVHDLSSTGT